MPKRRWIIVVWDTRAVLGKAWTERGAKRLKKRITTPGRGKRGVVPLPWTIDIIYKSR